jgi:hypothetical protein
VSEDTLGEQNAHLDYSLPLFWSSGRSQDQSDSNHAAEPFYSIRFPNLPIECCFASRIASLFKNCLIVSGKLARWPKIGMCKSWCFIFASIDIDMVPRYETWDNHSRYNGIKYQDICWFSWYLLDLGHKPMIFTSCDSQEQPQQGKTHTYSLDACSKDSVIFRDHKRKMINCVLLNSFHRYGHFPVSSDLSLLCINHGIILRLKRRIGVLRDCKVMLFGWGARLTGFTRILQPWPSLARWYNHGAKRWK